jgi:hypothetical protein
LIAIAALVASSGPGLAQIAPSQLRDDATFLRAQALQCTMRIGPGNYVFRFTFKDSAGGKPNFNIESGEAEDRTGPILRDRVEGGRRLFTTTTPDLEYDFALGADGRISVTAARRGRTPINIESSGTCKMSAA